MYPPRFSHVGDKMRNAERAFYDACVAQLDNSWTVLYEVQWFGRRNQGNERGDADFLLMNCKYGIFCVEVKGGQQIFVKDNQWYTVPHGLKEAVKIRDPFAQAADSKSVLWSFLKEKIAGIQLSGALGHFVVFPGVSIKSDVSLSARKSLTCDKDSLKNLPATIAEIANALGQKNSFSEKQIEEIRKVIFPSCELISQSQIKVEKAKSFMDEMTASQLEAFSMLNNWRELRVLGGAGTGKTSLAFYRARQLASQGARILFVTHSSNAADYLRNMIPEDLVERLIVESTENFFIRVMQKSSFAERGFSLDGFYDVYLQVQKGDQEDNEFVNQLNEMWLEAAINEGLLFDGLIIDEGQNIPLQVAELISNLLPNIGTRYLYIFGDRNQNIYFIEKTASDFDTGNLEVQLSVNCRSTAEIVAAAEYLIGNKQEIVGAVGIQPVLFFHPDFISSANHTTTDKLLQSPNQKVIVEALRFLVEKADLGIDANIQHLVVGGWELLLQSRPTAGTELEELGSIIDMSDWSHRPDAGQNLSHRNLNSIYLRKRTTLPRLVGLEVDGLIIELGTGLESYRIDEQREQLGDEFKSQFARFFEVLLDGYVSCLDAVTRGDSQKIFSPIEISNQVQKIFSPIEIANQSEFGALELDGYRRTIYSTISRARLGVVFVGRPFSLLIIKALLGDRCQQIYIEKTERADQ